jgi:hypothetical protein
MGALGWGQYPIFARLCCTFTWGRMPLPCTNCLIFVSISVTVGLSSCEGLWRSIFTYANFLLPDSLLPANMQNHPMHTGRSPAGTLPALLLLSPASPGCPGPTPRGGGRIRGGLEENVSEKGQEKKTRANPLIQNLHLKKSPSPVTAALLKGWPHHRVSASLRDGRCPWPLV